MVLIYTKNTSKRFNYIAELLLKDLAGFDISYTNSEDEFSQFSGPKISYGKRKLKDEIFFNASGLLFETGINEQKIEIGKHKDIATLFVHSCTSALPFDPFAAAFYMVSRYEEYLPHIQDKFGRYVPSESIAVQNNFLQFPVVNHWAEMLKECILQKFPNEVFRKRAYNVLLTVDIDNAWAFRQKGLIRTLGAGLRNIYKLEFEELMARASVLARIKKDPFDTYEELLQIQKKYNLHPIYFFLVADYGTNDKNIAYNNPKLHDLIKSVSDTSEIGIHPSYASTFKPEMVRKEIYRLEQITKRDIKKSRQHFLKLFLPDTYTTLANLEITSDYSMGYASEIGFRAGIATPFRFYNLDQECVSPLTVHPFCIMDATLGYYMKLKPENVADYVKPLINNVKAVNGELCILWHNETLSNHNRWKGWKNTLENILDLATDRKE